MQTQTAVSTTTTAAVTATALRCATALKAGRDIAVSLAADLVPLVAEEGSPKDAGAALKAAWASLNEKQGDLPARLLVDACHLGGISRADVSALVYATKAVTRQRVSQLVAVIYDGDKSKNKGKAAKGGKTDKAEKSPAPEGGKSESQDGLDSLVADAPKAAPKAAPTVEDILALIADLPAITQADASRLAAALKAKLA